MRHRVSWLNNPYLWIFGVAIGLVGVANWRSDDRDRYEPTAWELAHDVRPGEVSYVFEDAGSSESLTTYRDTRPSESQSFRVAGSDRPSRHFPGVVPRPLGDVSAPAYPGGQELRP
jgi:hypothetical protein